MTCIVLVQKISENCEYHNKTQLLDPSSALLYNTNDDTIQVEIRDVVSINLLHRKCQDYVNIKWEYWSTMKTKHDEKRHQMETFSVLLVFCAGNSPLTGEFPHKGQWHGSLMSSFICAWINGWVNWLVIRDAVALIITSLQCDIIYLFRVKWQNKNIFSDANADIVG